MNLLKTTMIYLAAGIILTGCSSSLSFKSDEAGDPDDLLSSISSFEGTLNGEFCDDLNELIKIYDKAVLAGVDVRLLNLELPFFESIFRNFDFDAAKGRYETVKKKYEKGDKKSGLSGKKDPGSDVKEPGKIRTEPSIKEFLSAGLGSCLEDKETTDKLVDILFAIYSKYSVLPKALLANPGFPGLINLDTESFNSYDSCFKDIDAFISNDLKFFVQNADYNQPVSEVLEERGVLGESLPECLKEMFGGEEGQDQDLYCDTEFTLRAYNPVNGDDFVDYPVGFDWTYSEQTIDISNLFFDDFGLPIRPIGSVSFWYEDPNKEFVHYNASTSQESYYQGSVNIGSLVHGDYIRARCTNGYKGTERTIYITQVK
jgi:hypothetical protein